MKIGVRKSPHLELAVQGILACGDTLTSEYDTGADFFLCWGWPQAQQVAKDVGPEHVSRIICVDCHPFALRAGDRSGGRIFQLGNWGALAKYPPSEMLVSTPRHRGNPNGPVLILGQVYTAIQAAGGLVDTWHTGGYEKWCATELAKPNRKFRKHPRVWAVENNGEVQPTLEEDLAGCFMAVSWNSTSAIHARMMGYHATAYEAHGWAHMSLNQLAGLLVLPEELRSGAFWQRYRDWLLLGAPSNEHVAA